MRRTDKKMVEEGKEVLELKNIEKTTGKTQGAKNAGEKRGQHAWGKGFCPQRTRADEGKEKIPAEL